MISPIRQCGFNYMSAYARIDAIDLASTMARGTLLFVFLFSVCFSELLLILINELRFCCHNLNYCRIISCDMY